MVEGGAIKLRTERLVLPTVGESLRFELSVELIGEQRHLTNAFGARALDRSEQWMLGSIHHTQVQILRTRLDQIRPCALCVGPSTIRILSHVGILGQVVPAGIVRRELRITIVWG